MSCDLLRKSVKYCCDGFHVAGGDIKLLRKEIQYLRRSNQELKSETARLKENIRQPGITFTINYSRDQDLPL